MHCRHVYVTPAIPQFDGHDMNRTFEPSCRPQVEPEPQGGARTGRHVTLEVCRGITRFPNRPVLSERFLIGAADECHLRLGGESMPALHSILLCQDTAVHLEALAQSPELRVNGAVVADALLNDGDTIEIGPFALLVHCVEQSAPAAAAAPGCTVKLTADMVAEETPLRLNASEMSAEELADALEAEDQLIDALESGRHLGAKALLQSALERALLREQEHARIVDAPPDESLSGELPLVSLDHPAPRQAISASPNPIAAQQPELERLIERLDQFSHELESRSLQLADRESRYAEMFAELIQAQRMLLDHLDLLERQVAELSMHKPDSLRVIA